MCKNKSTDEGLPRTGIHGTKERILTVGLGRRQESSNHLRSGTLTGNCHLVLVSSEGSNDLLDIGKRVNDVPNSVVGARGDVGGRQEAKDTKSVLKRICGSPNKISALGKGVQKEKN